VPPVIGTVATDGAGVAAVVAAIDRFRDQMSARISDRREARVANRSGTTRPRVDHVGVAVSDAEPLLSFLSSAFAADAGPAIDVPAHGVRVRFVPLGAATLEVIETLGSESPIARFLARRGPGLHHLAVEVDDIERTLLELRARGVRLVDEAPRPGADGRAVAFVHPSAAGGVLVELVSKERHRREDR
jgi:methylmalonyl-CoA/ethylmalonyl-CoA epimerase